MPAGSAVSVLMVSVPLTDRSPVTAADAAEQVGTSVTPEGGVTVQVNTTFPVNPLLGATTHASFAGRRFSLRKYSKTVGFSGDTSAKLLNRSYTPVARDAVAT